MATLATGIAAAGLANGYYADARRFAARAIRTDPRARSAYLYFLLALGGSHTYRSASWLRQTAGRFTGRHTVDPT